MGVKNAVTDCGNPIVRTGTISGKMFENRFEVTELMGIAVVFTTYGNGDQYLLVRNTSFPSTGKELKWYPLQSTSGTLQT